MIGELRDKLLAGANPIGYLGAELKLLMERLNGYADIAEECIQLNDEKSSSLGDKVNELDTMISEEKQTKRNWDDGDVVLKLTHILNRLKNAQKIIMKL